MQLPATIGDYELLEFLRGDETAEVYQARDTATQTPAVVILLTAEASANAELRARFLRDARGAGMLDSGQYEGCTYAVMEERKAALLMGAAGGGRKSTGGQILRLSMIVYATVILITVIAIFTWFRYSRLFPEDKPESREHLVKGGPDVVRGMIYIEGGAFLAGPDNHKATLAPFYIDQTAVTVGQYCAVMQCPASPGRVDWPMVNVTVAQARQYAAQVGRRLPTALEWERAARGPKGNRYPWGNELDPSLVNVANNAALGGHGLVPAKAFRPYPEYQMIGNVWEMVEGAVAPSPNAIAAFAHLLSPSPTASEPWISARGGSYRTPLTTNTMWDSLVFPERYSAPDLGFRCARNE